MKMQVTRLNEAAKLPQYAHGGDAGMDLFTIDARTIHPGERVQVRTGIAVAIPDGYVGLVWDKSGLSQKSGLKTLGGVIDAGYRGEILIGLVNIGTTPHTFAIGDKVAQMLIQRVERVQIEEIESLDSTTRGGDGFGSTGV